MQTRRWVNPTQPQTMQIAVFLLYFTAVFAIIFDIRDAYHILVFRNDGNLALVRLLIGGGGVAAGYGIATERKWGYLLGLGVAALPLVVRLYASLRYSIGPFDDNFIGGMFDVALIALLLHPQSRDYQRIWFK